MTYTTVPDLLKGIGDAIRTANGDTTGNTINAQDMPAKINKLVGQHSDGTIYDGVTSKDYTVDDCDSGLYTSNDILGEELIDDDGSPIYVACSMLGSSNNQKILDEGDGMYIGIRSSDLGNAAAASVLPGSTFTSTAGIKVEGTMNKISSLSTSSSPYVSGSNLVLSPTFSTIGYVENPKVTINSPLNNFGTAIAANVLTGKTFTSSSGLKVTGTMPSVSGRTITPSTSSQTAIASGSYAAGNITVSGSSNLIASNIKSGVNIFGVTGSLSSAKLYTGTVSSFYNKGSGDGGYLTFTFNETLPSTIYALEIHYIDKLYTSDWYMHSLTVGIPEGITASTLTGTSKTSIPGYCVCKDEDDNTYYGWTYLSFQRYSGTSLRYFGVGMAVLNSSSSQTIKYFPIMLLNNDSSATYELQCNIFGS